eukprot:1152765-Pelagomonas_calceolata.AAC.4
MLRCASRRRTGSQPHPVRRPPVHSTRTPARCPPGMRDHCLEAGPPSSSGAGQQGPWRAPLLVRAHPFDLVPLP